MTQTLFALSAKLQQIRDPLADLLSFLRDLTELTRTLYLQFFRAAASSDQKDETKLAAYRLALEAIFGVKIDIDSRINISFAMLDEYYKGLDTFAVFLERAYGEKLSDYDRYLLFQAVMGKMTILATLSRPMDPQGNPILKGDGYSDANTIWDMYADISGRRRSYIMPADLLMHEFFHSFNKFAGFGMEKLGSPFTDEFRELRDKFHEATANDTRRRNPSGDATEILADLGLFYARGYIPSKYAGLELGEIYKRLIRQATLYRTNPNDYAERAGLVSKSTAPKLGVVMRYNTASANGIASGIVQINPQNALRGVKSGQKVTALARSRVIADNSPGGLIERSWIYVAVSDNNQTFTYGWIRRDNLNLSNAEANELPIISFDAVDPARQYQKGDPFNP
jgi:hypothetical protein